MRKILTGQWTLTLNMGCDINSGKASTPHLERYRLANVKCGVSSNTDLKMTDINELEHLQAKCYKMKLIILIFLKNLLRGEKKC